MKQQTERPPAPGRRWLWPAVAAISVAAVAYLAYVARSACPPIQRGRLVDVEMVHGLAVGRDGRTLYVAALDGLLRGEGLGRSWAPVQRLCRTDVTAVVFAAAAPERAWAADHTLGVLGSRDGGESFRPTGAGLPGADVHGLAVDADPNRLYAWVVGAGLWTSPDGGQSWRPLRADALEVGDVYHLGAHPTRPGYLYAAGATGVAVSADGGRTWRRLPTWPGEAYGTAVRPGEPERLLVAAGQRGVFLSDDGGQTWRPGANLEGEVTALTVHPQQPDWVLAATATGRIFESRNGGDVWSPR